MLLPLTSGSTRYVQCPHSEATATGKGGVLSELKWTVIDPVQQWRPDNWISGSKSGRTVRLDSFQNRLQRFGVAYREVTVLHNSLDGPIDCTFLTGTLRRLVA